MTKLQFETITLTIKAKLEQTRQLIKEYDAIISDYLFLDLEIPADKQGQGVELKQLEAEYLDHLYTVYAMWNDQNAKPVPTSILG